MARGWRGVTAVVHPARRAHWLRARDEASCIDQVKCADVAANRKPLLPVQLGGDDASVQFNLIFGCV
jgi:hypothetical protein